ncbi:MAG: hypothetical protein HYX21_04205 [Candidatus Yanofskybacteria bacterium]|nr:hypothetical protein [Candidatus Yanofskybacteria bacterium]
MNYDSTKKMYLPAAARGERGVVNSNHPSGMVGVRFSKFVGYGHQPYFYYFKESDLIEL